MSCFLSSLKKGSPQALSLEMNQLKAAMHPVSFCTSRRLSGGVKFMIANIFSRLGSIPRWETIYPGSYVKKLTEWSDKRHLDLIFNFEEDLVISGVAIQEA
jgi:hypothetical protein